MDNRSHFRSLDELIRGLDRERALERTTSTGDMDKFQEAICAFANDNGGNVGGIVGGNIGGNVVENIAENVVENIVSTDAKDAISSSKVATLDEKVASSEPKVATSEEKVATLKKKVSSEEMAIYILEYCDTWRSMDEIAQFSNRDKNYIRNKVLPKLAEKLEKEYPDIPNHPQQRYRTKPKDSQIS